MTVDEYISLKNGYDREARFYLYGYATGTGMDEEIRKLDGFIITSVAGSKRVAEVFNWGKEDGEGENGS